MSNPTLKDNPLLYLKNRAARLARLAELSAPFVIITAELGLVQQAYDEARKQHEEKK